MIAINERPSSGFGLSPATVQIVRNAMKGAFKFAVQHKLLVENPVLETTLPVVNTSSATSMTIEECQAFESVKNDFWYGDAFVFQLYTGLRNQELMALIWDDIDFNNNTLRVERACQWVHGSLAEIGKTKTKRSNRVIALSPKVMSLLQLHYEKQSKHIEEYTKQNADYGEDKINKWMKKHRLKLAYHYQRTNLIFPKPNGKVPPSDAPRKEFKAMLQRAGIMNNERGLRWYDLRHTHASLLLLTATPHIEIAERMGHTLAVLYSKYAHIIASRRHVAANAFADLISVEGGNAD
jgi:integrase